jgi:predicted MFS family arabinose efflux permease
MSDSWQERWVLPARLALGTASALGLARFAYGLLVPAMRSELHWSLAQAGALTTANGVGYLLGAIASALVARRLGVTATFRLGMVVTAAALAATAASSSYPVLLLTRAVAGLSGAFVFITGGVIASHAAARARSAAPLAIYFSGAGLGIAVSGVFIPPVLAGDPGRWPLVWVALGAGAVLATVVSWTAARGPNEISTTANGLDLAALARLWPVTGAYLLFAAGYIAYITFLSAYLAAHHASVVQEALTWALLGLAAVVAPALWSRPIGTWRGARALATALAVIGTASLIALVSATPAAVTVSAIGYGASFLAVPAAVTSAVRESIPPADWTRALATFTIVFAAGQTAGPYLAGALADRYGAGATLAWTAALCAAAAALALLTPSRSRQR